VPKPKNRTPGVIGYLRCSTDEQAVRGLGLAAQEAAIRAECEHRGVPLLALHSDAGLSGKNLARPGLRAALSALEHGKGSALMVARLDRLSRNVHDITGIMDAAEKQAWGLVALDAPVDTTTPAGAAMAHILATFAQLERRLIGERTKAALAVKKARGVRLGRPPTLPTDVVQRIFAAKEAGATLSAIARELNDEGVPTAQGGRRWYPSTVRSVALSAGTAA
jgi:DNA invertase Pin-like site-specific DNA recombinase